MSNYYHRIPYLISPQDFPPQGQDPEIVNLTGDQLTVPQIAVRLRKLPQSPLRIFTPRALMRNYMRCGYKFLIRMGEADRVYALRERGASWRVIMRDVRRGFKTCKLLYLIGEKQHADRLIEVDFGARIIFEKK